MKRKLLLLVASFLFISLVLSACGGGTALPTDTPGSGGGAPADPGGAGSSVGPAAGSVDASTGLTWPAFAPIPSGATAPTNPTSPASATIWIEGGLPLVLNNGECANIDGSTFVVAPAGGISPPPNASLVIEPGEGRNRVGTLTWAVGGEANQTAGVTMMLPLQITLNADDVSGSFSGTGFLGDFTRIAVTGVFNCVAPLARVGGPHPVDISGASCQITPYFVLSAGGGGSENAVMLAIDGGYAPGGTAGGRVAWRVGGVQYMSTWLHVSINPDGLSGSYFGEATGPDGSSFEFDGTFNCLGSR